MPSDIERAGVEAKTVEDGKTPDEQTALDYWRARALAAEVLARAAERDLRGGVEEIERLRGVIAEAVDAIQERRVEDAIQMLLNALDAAGGQ